MDRNYDIDNFERLLKERADEFRMYPSAKTWYSIYNNLYPGKRFPSALISIIIISSISILGLLNNHLSIEAVSQKNNYASFEQKTIASKLQNATLVDKNYLNRPVSLTQIKAITTVNKNRHQLSQNNFTVKSINISQQQELAKQIAASFISSAADIISKQSAVTVVEKTERDNTILNARSFFISATNNYIAANDRFVKKSADRITLQVYASPYVAYGQGSGLRTGSVAGIENSNAFDNSPVGLEAGTAMQYSLSGLIKVKAGVQFNYASYNMAAYQNEIGTDLAESKTGFASTSISPVTLHNEMYQFSLPVGLEFKLFKHNNLQLNAGATIQPSYIAGGNAYLFSSESRNSTDESSSLNRWNFNAGFETFITYKLKGITWQFGPQMRYQFSSLYSRSYTPLDEKLMNFGLKFGISKTIH